MHHVDFPSGFWAQLPLLFSQPSVLSVMVVAAIAVLVHEARRIVALPHSIALKARGHQRAVARRDGGAVSADAATRREAAEASLALAPLVDVPPEAGHGTPGAGTAIRIALACLIVGAVAGWLVIRAARRRTAV
ncbi:MAG: hypothetical protein M3P30_13845 [Chloroflexota bacterium]|nr:hypothetical protein [Chloroflexota bacterium]